MDEPTVLSVELKSTFSRRAKPGMREWRMRLWRDGIENVFMERWNRECVYGEMESRMCLWKMI